MRRLTFFHLLLLTPSQALATIMLAGPALYVFWLSFTTSNYGLDPQFVGLANYITVLTDHHFWTATWNTFLIVNVVVYVELLLGFGMALLVAAFWVLVWRGMLVAVRAPDEFGMLMAAGITSLIGIQFLINILVVTSSMPPTGVPLPFISNGNTSLVVFMAVVGMLLNVSKHSVKT